MDKKDLLEIVFDKQEHIANELAEIKVITAKQEENLRHHMYRTQIAEENIELLRGEMKPVQDHVRIVEASLKILGLISLIVGLITGVIEIAHFFK